MHGQPGEERRAHAGRARHRERAPQQLGELARQRQTEAGAVNLALHVALELAELLEDPLLVLGSDPDARVGHREDDGIAVGRERRRHAHLALLRELQRVGDEVAQDLGDLPLVRVEGRQIAGRLEHERHRFAQKQRAEHAAQ
jgi:hypothetical protein